MIVEFQFFPAWFGQETFDVFSERQHHLIKVLILNLRGCGYGGFAIKQLNCFIFFAQHRRNLLIKALECTESLTDVELTMLQSFEHYKTAKENV